MAVASVSRGEGVGCYSRARHTGGWTVRTHLFCPAAGKSVLIMKVDCIQLSLSWKFPSTHKSRVCLRIVSFGHLGACSLSLYFTYAEFHCTTSIWYCLILGSRLLMLTCPEGWFCSCTVHRPASQSSWHSASKPAFCDSIVR